MLRVVARVRCVHVRHADHSCLVGTHHWGDVVEIIGYNEIISWQDECRNRAGNAASRHLLLGNGFSIAYDYNRFSYAALLQRAKDEGLIGTISGKLFDALKTQDFEAVIKSLSSSIDALQILDSVKYASEIILLTNEVDRLKEALAQVLAALHPDRPFDISDDAYIQVRNFLDPFEKTYTANYDLLLYWAYMQSINGKERKSDDGFRDPKHEADYVLWNYLQPHSQSVYYLHGALHLFRGDDGLRKLTWCRTEIPLLDQIRKQLAQDYFPVYVAEGSSQEKLTKIQSSDYLSRGLRSLAAIHGSLTAFGLSFSANDEHINEAITRSKIFRLGVGVYGDPALSNNKALMMAAKSLEGRRNVVDNRHPLQVRFFDAGDVPLWN